MLRRETQVKAFLPSGNDFFINGTAYFRDRGVIMLCGDMEFDRLLRLAATVQSSQASAVDEPKVSLRNRPIREEVELRAYQIYLCRGSVHGFDLEDWLQAEREVTLARTGKSLARRD